MKRYLILRDFKGSQDGVNVEHFVAGAKVDLSDSLAAAIGGPEGGFIRELTVAAKEIAKAPFALADAVKESIAEAGRRIAEGEVEKVEEAYLDDRPLNPDLRETKVVEPDETKPAKPLARMSKAELVAFALSQGLELVPDSMTIKQMIAAIEEKAGGQ